MIAGFSAKARQTMNLEGALGKITALLNGSRPGRFGENTQAVPKRGFTLARIRISGTTTRRAIQASFVDESLHRDSALVPHSLHHMTVAIQGKRCGTVPEIHLQDLHIDGGPDRISFEERHDMMDTVIEEQWIFGYNDIRAWRENNRL